MYPSISVRKEVAHYQLVLGKTLLLSAISSSAPGFLRRAVDDVRGRAGSVLPPQVWLLQETLLPWLFIHFANNFPQGWFLFLLSCASSPHAAVPPCRADARGRLLCAPTIAFQSGSLCAAHGGCVFLFRGWEDLASITIRLPKAISQGHLLCNNHRVWITAIEVAWVKALKRPVCTENVRSCCRLEVRAQERDCRPFSSVMVVSPTCQEQVLA